MIPNTLTIAGVDPSGGAGILADVKAMSALGAYATAVIAALTAQNTQGVTGISPVPADFVRQQIDTLFADVRIDGVKIGMLGQEAVTTVVAERMAHFKPQHLVLDPVMIAKSGDHLLEKSAVHALREQLVPQCTMITPNLPEAAHLTGLPPDAPAEATAAALKDGWLFTGDVGVLDADGFLTLKDRSKDLVISGGSNIYPREVEEVLLTAPGVAEVAVVGAPDAEWGEVVVAFVVAAPGAMLDVGALDAHCLAQMARFKRPKRYLLVPALPKNNYGKVLKTALRAQLGQPTPAAPGATTSGDRQ